jgi:hypothetical protein
VKRTSVRYKFSGRAGLNPIFGGPFQNEGTAAGSHSTRPGIIACLCSSPFQTTSILYLGRPRPCYEVLPRP